MITIYSDAHLGHQPEREFFEARWQPFQESAARAQTILRAVQDARLGEVIAPRAFGLEPLLAVHDGAYLGYLQTAYARWVEAGHDPAGVFGDAFPLRGMRHRPETPMALAGYYNMDLTAVVVAGTWPAAHAAAQCALTGAALLAEGTPAAFALCRPPGHHAHRDLSGGYCFVNNAAAAAQALSAAGKVAVLDVDYHHGNGTQDIFYERDDVLFVSIHADPKRQFPYFIGGRDERGAGRGWGFNANYPLEIGVDDARYLGVLEAACEDVARFRPDAVVISLGVDTFGGDPLGDFALTGEAFPRIGARIAQLGRPTLFVMEGGYAVDALGRNVTGVLAGFQAGRV